MGGVLFGYLKRQPKGLEIVVDPAEYYFRATPVLTAPSGKYEWLNRSLFVCSGARFATAITLWVYQIL